MSEQTQQQKITLLQKGLKSINIRTIFTMIAGTVILGVGGYGFNAIKDFVKQNDVNKKISDRVLALEKRDSTKTKYIWEIRSENQSIKQSQEAMQKGIDNLTTTVETKFTNIYNLLVEINRK